MAEMCFCLLWFPFTDLLTVTTSTFVTSSHLSLATCYFKCFSLTTLCTWAVLNFLFKCCTSILQKYAEKELQGGLRHHREYVTVQRFRTLISDCFKFTLTKQCFCVNLLIFLNVANSFTLQQVSAVLLYFITVEGFCKFSLFVADSWLNYTTALSLVNDILECNINNRVNVPNN